MNNEIYNPADKSEISKINALTHNDNIPIDYKKIKLKVNTDKSELNDFGHELRNIYHAFLNEENTILKTFIDREIRNVLLKVFKKITSPNEKCKSISFNYYETKALQYIAENQLISALFIAFNEIYRKLDRQFNEPK